jgi:transposase InsO family protein
VVTRPNAKWVADITYVRTWSGFLYLAFTLGCYSRAIGGWQLATTHLRSELVLDALEMANGLRPPTEGLIAHNDRGTQYTSLRYTEQPPRSPSRPSRSRRAQELARVQLPQHSGAPTAASSQDNAWMTQRFAGRTESITNRQPLLSLNFQALFVLCPENKRPAFAGLSWS